MFVLSGIDERNSIMSGLRRRTITPMLITQNTVQLILKSIVCKTGYFIYSSFPHIQSIDDVCFIFNFFKYRYFFFRGCLCSSLNIQTYSLVHHNRTHSHLVFFFFSFLKNHFSRSLISLPTK